MTTIERTQKARANGTYSYEAIWAALLALLPYVPDVINWLLTDPMAPTVPDVAKKILNALAFLMALYARSIVVRKPPAQDEGDAP